MPEEVNINTPKKLLLRRYGWIVIVIIILAIVGLVAYKYTGWQRSNEKFTLSSEVGKVSFKTTGGEYQVNNNSFTELANHSLVKTTETTAVVAISNFATVMVDKNTEIQVNIYKKGVTIRQVSGKVSYRIDESKKDGRYFYVRTPQSIVKEQGTWFTINIFGNTITCDVEEGSVYSTVIDRVYLDYDPNGSEVQPVSWVSIPPVRINVYPDGSWGFGTLDYDPTPGAENRYNYDGTPINAGDSGVVQPALDGGRGTTTTTPGAGRTSAAREIRERAGRAMDEAERMENNGEISHEEANRRIRDAYNRMVQELATIAGVNVTDQPILTSVNSCDQLRAHTIPSGLAAAARYRNAAMTVPHAADLVPRGIDYYENFLNHVCDDNMVSGEEQAYINEITAWAGY